MSYILITVILLLLTFYLVAKRYVDKKNKSFLGGIMLSYVDYFSKKGVFIIVPLAIVVLLETSLAYSDFIRFTEVYAKIESAKAETRGYVYEYCRDRRCACYYFRIIVNGKEYTGCAGVEYPLHVGDSIDVYYYKPDPDCCTYKADHKKVVDSYWLYLDDLNYGFFQSLFYKKEESKEKHK